MNPTLNMIGKVPTQNRVIISIAVRGLAELSASATKAYSHPHGSSVVMSPIKNGLASLFIENTGFVRREIGAVSQRKAEEKKSELIPVIRNKPIAIKVEPTKREENLATPESESIDEPIVAAAKPRLRYVVSRPRLYSKWGVT